MRIPAERVLAVSKHCGIAFLPVALLVLTSGKPIQAQTFQMSITCDSGGLQTCTPVFPAAIAVGQAGPLTITVTASSTHCSSVGYIVAVDANVVTTTPFLSAGQSSAPIVTAPVSSGPHTVTVQASGPRADAIPSVWVHGEEHWWYRRSRTPPREPT